MSKIALTPNATGTGVFTIASPATNTDRTLTLPDEAGSIVVNTATGIDVTGNVELSANNSLILNSTSTAHTNRINWDYDGTTYAHIGRENSTGAMQFTVQSAERCRIDSSGNLLVGHTSRDFPVDNGGAGVTLRPTGVMLIGGTGTSIYANREDSDGEIVQFRKDGAPVGSIARASNAFQVIAPAVSGTYNMLQLGASAQNQNTYYLQWDAHNGGFYSFNDNTHDLGKPSNRWDNIYATNGTIQTSDRNEKQDIEVLSDAETRVAVACKGLIRKFRFIDAVEAKGDDARIHFGIIAQDLQDAFAAEGLDASRYAMFCSDTWWETQTDVPAVEAIAEVLDEEGNVVTEAVEAKEAYIRTDHYDTLEEAPEGATERTRLGVRYPELLAFIIGAL